MKALHETKFFDGPENGKIFSHNISLLEKGQYRLIGRLVALSLAQDGPGLHFILDDLYDMFVGQKPQLMKVELPEDTDFMIQQVNIV